MTEQEPRQPVYRDEFDRFNEANAEAMRQRMEDGSTKFGRYSWREEPYRDGDNLHRLERAVDHLVMALAVYDSGAVGIDEVRKRAADVANQAFMYADPERCRS